MKDLVFFYIVLAATTVGASPATKPSPSTPTSTAGKPLCDLFCPYRYTCEINSTPPYSQSCVPLTTTTSPPPATTEICDIYCPFGYVCTFSSDAAHTAECVKLASTTTWAASPPPPAQSAPASKKLCNLYCPYGEVCVFPGADPDTPKCVKPVACDATIPVACPEGESCEADPRNHCDPGPMCAGVCA